MDAMSCLAPPPLISGSAFTDAAIARALHFSVSDSSYAPSPLLADYAARGFASAPPAMVTCESVLVADSARPSPPGHGRAQQQRLAPAGGRAGKRRSRASKRTPTTYISTDPANFRLMVQQITGIQTDQLSLADAGILLHPTPPFDASMLMDGSPFGDALTPPPPASDDSAALHHQHHQLQPPCFPTLDSWSVMYQNSDLL